MAVRGVCCCSWPLVDGGLLPQNATGWSGRGGCCGAWCISHLPVLPQDLVGYVLHTALLVPYFSWQRSHAVHHSRTNHITEGETHVPVL